MPRYYNQDQTFAGGFRQGVGTVSDLASLYYGVRKLSREDEAERRGIEVMQEYYGDLAKDTGTEIAKNQASRAANSAAQEFGQMLSSTEPGSPERRAIVSGLPMHKQAQEYFTRADNAAIESLAGAVTSDDAIGKDQMKQILTDPMAFSMAIGKASQRQKALQADPERFSFQQELAGLARQQAAIEKKIQRAMTFYERIPAGSAEGKKLESIIGGLTQQFKVLEQKRNNLASPQTFTFSSGTENVGKMVDSQSGEFIELGRSELPVYVQQRAQDARTRFVERGRNAREAIKEKGRFTRAAMSNAAQSSEFARTMQAAGIKPGSAEYVKAARIKARLEPGIDDGAPKFPTDDEIGYTSTRLEKDDLDTDLAAEIAAAAKVRAREAGMTIPDAIAAEIDERFPDKDVSPSWYSSIIDALLGRPQGGSPEAGTSSGKTSSGLRYTIEP